MDSAANYFMLPSVSSLKREIHILRNRFGTDVSIIRVFGGHIVTAFDAMLY
jgi:hypothetical protein